MFETAHNGGHNGGHSGGQHSRSIRRRRFFDIEEVRVARCASVIWRRRRLGLTSHMSLAAYEQRQFSLRAPRILSSAGRAPGLGHCLMYASGTCARSGLDVQLLELVLHRSHFLRNRKKTFQNGSCEGCLWKRKTTRRNASSSVSDPLLTGS